MSNKELPLEAYVKTQPREHQKKALELSKNKKNFAYFMEMGCVDGETEFLSNRGWIKFKDFKLNDWEAPLLVAQVEDAKYDDTPYRKIMSFVPPISYIHKKVDCMYHFYNKKHGEQVDMMLTGNHRWVGRYHKDAGSRHGTDEYIYGEFLAEKSEKLSRILIVRLIERMILLTYFRSAGTLTAVRGTLLRGITCLS